MSGSDLFSLSHLLIWLIAAAAMACVLLRPRDWPEAIWAVIGAALLLVTGLLSVSQGLRAVANGFDVYCFLIGMMLLAGLARREGLFAWVAAQALRQARGSSSRLFGLVYLVGVIVTVFLSNDATAVVLTPAVYALAKAAKVKPLPYLLICAFVANAASFVLPISNPANLVVFRAAMPSLASWLAQFFLPSVVAIVVTFALLRWTQRNEMHNTLSRDVTLPTLSSAGKLSAVGITATAVLLLVVSWLGLALGLPTLGAALVTACGVAVIKRDRSMAVLRELSWSVIPLVAGLFVLVQGVESTGVFAPLSIALHHASSAASASTALAAGCGVALLGNLINNLPLGLLSGTLIAQAHLPPVVNGAVLLGVDLGPNLSVTGSLATILWLLELRKVGVHVSAWAFLKIGCCVMPVALLLSLAALIATSP